MAASPDDPVAAYKSILQSIIERRPSGMRLKIAGALGKHKSFVSQITNPSYAVPVPARHLETILEICHASPEEREQFLLAYARAHPGRAPPIRPEADRGRPHRTITIELPILDDPVRQAELEDLIRQFARRVGGLARS